MTNEISVHTDGGARGNPGPAAIGVVIERQGKIISAFGKKIGNTTNNVAEYTAVLEALKYLKNTRGVSAICFFIDSNLVVQQLNGKFKIKDMKLRDLAFKIKILEQEVGGVITYSAVPREKNRHADLLVNQALDNVSS